MAITIDRAIERLGALSRQPWLATFPDFVAASKLGEEALKRIQRNRCCEPELQHTLLPGETED